MPVNSSDATFFEHASKIMKQALSDINGEPTIDDIRGTIKYFKKYLSDEPLLPFEVLLIPSSYASHKIRARFIAQGSETRPLIIFFPGTAFMHDMFDENYTVLSRMMKRIDAHGLMLEYRLSPENPYPAPHEDASDALQYVLDKLEGLNIDSHKIVISGHSSGANMAAVLCNALQHTTACMPSQYQTPSGVPLCRGL